MMKRAKAKQCQKPSLATEGSRVHLKGPHHIK